MDINQLTAKFATNEKVVKFITDFRKKYNLSDYYFAPGSGDHLETRKELIEAGAEQEIDDFVKEFLLEVDDDPVSRVLFMQPEQATQELIKPLAEIITTQIINSIPETMTLQNLLDNEAFAWFFSAFVGNPRQQLLDLAITGATQSLDKNILGRVDVHELFGEQVITATISELTDIDEVVEEVREKYLELFGSEKERTKKNTLRDAFFEHRFVQGMTNGQIAELWVEDDPSIIPGYSSGLIPKEDLGRLINLIKQARKRLKDK